MNQKSKNKFTVKIMLSYLVLCALAVSAGYFIYSEIRIFMSTDTVEKNDLKLLKTGSLVAELYEAESLSKLALQSKTQKNFKAYEQKIDTIYLEIDTLKQLTNSEFQKSLLDSLQILLRQKVANSNELRTLKVKNEANSSIDQALKGFSKMEASFGKLTIESFEKNPEKLSPYKRKVLEDWVAYLNANIPSDTSAAPNAKKIDSILNASKALLAEAKKNDVKTQRFLAQKEQQINQTDLELSQQLRSIISAFEQEVIVNTYNDNLKKQTALRRSMRLAGIAALLGFIVVVLFTFLINRDFWKVQTYRQRLEKEKKYSESLLKSREQLISTVSHDLRTPLNTITGYTELIENTTIDNKQTKYLENIKSASAYVGNLVNDLLDFSKLEAGKLKIEQVPFIAKHLIQETAEHVASLYERKNLQLILNLDSELENTVSGDPFRLRQILTNLIGNAFKFTEKGSITINAKITEAAMKKVSLQIEVIDTGIGIAKEKQDFIFKEFTQAENTTDQKYGGYGLGLTISKKLADFLNGSLKLQSSKGKGSTFTLQLPLEYTARKVILNTPTAYFGPESKMLIIDDDTALLSMLKELTESMGITAHTFSSFLAVNKKASLSYDLVLTDIQMPEMSGFEVLKELQSGNYTHYREQPIVAMTGKRDLHIESYYRKGFAQVLQKPFSKKELIVVFNALGIITDDSGNEASPVLSEMNSPTLFSLEIIRSFLGANEEGVQDVLQTFLEDTKNNMGTLDTAVKVLDYGQINQISHKMLPMFRQLKVKTIVPFLEKLEILKKGDLSSEQLKDAYLRLRKNMDNLISALEKRLVTNPTYND